MLCCSVASIALLPLGGCHWPGRPTAADIVPRPEDVTSFHVLYAENCAGCHGAKGENGAATDLANPEYEALIDDATLRDVIANGEKGTLMPGFAQSSGGNLTDRQVDALVQGMRAAWAHGNALAGQNAPPYKASGGGDAAHGQQVYAAACARCHGATPQQPGTAGSILDGSFLALVNAQTIRTTVIAGRPDIGQPDWRGDVPGHPLSDAEVTDVTAWLLAQRPPNPGQPYPNATTTSERPGEAQPIATGNAPKQKQISPSNKRR
jgi:cytochrome c oxidase cbb3-type subunit 3/ubiquinol-cytochrome c reductase cytochrome c subunit